MTKGTLLAFLIPALLGFSQPDAAWRMAPVPPLEAPEPAPKAAPRPPVRQVVGLKIQQASTPNQDARPAGCKVDAIVVHDTKSPGVTTAAAIARWFARPDARVSAHYVIGKAGEVVQCVPDVARAWHAGPSQLAGRRRVNDFSVGIELVNDETNHDPFTDAQYRSLALLTADLMTRYKVPFTRIVGHRHVTDYPEERQDPANNFDWARYRAAVKQVLATKTVRRLPDGILVASK
jgi:N-acetyl-anhydromuramyl-L-alanine amidase AmpD